MSSTHTHTIHIYVNEEDKPANFPNYETIIIKSRELRPGQQTDVNFSGVKIPLEKESDNDVSSIWVKFGEGIRMGEARTQRYVSQHLGGNDIVRAPRVYLAFTWGVWGFIVSEYVEGRMCNDSDIPLVVAAMQSLIEIPSPPDQTMPGPVGGGIIEHPGFHDRESPIWYETVQELEDHINGILRSMERPWRVNFKKELATYGLRLCPSDTVLTNFMRDDKDGVVAVDFAGYSFLPASFLTTAVEHANYSKLRQSILGNLKYPRARSKTALAICNVALALAPFGTNKIGIPSRLKPRLKTRSPL